MGATINMTDLDLADLASPDWKKRKQAVEALANSGSQELAQHLIEMIRQNHRDPNALNASLSLLAELNTPVTGMLVDLLTDPDPEVRMYAVLALGETRDPACIPALIQCLDDPDQNVRFNAVEALGKLHAREAVERLIAILQEKDFFLAFAAAQALAEIGDPRPVPALIPLLGNQALKPAVVNALGRLGNAVEINPIVESIGSDTGNIQAGVIALVSLGQRVDAGRDVVYHISPSVYKKVLSAVPCSSEADLTLGEPQFYASLAVLLGWLYRWHPEPPEDLHMIAYGLVCLLGFPLVYGSDQIREAAFHSLQEIGPGAVSELCAGLTGNQQHQRQACARLLSQLDDLYSIPALLEALDAGDDAVSADIVTALARIAHTHPEASEDLLDPLVAQLESDSPSVHRAAVNALSGLDHPGLPQRLSPLLQHPSWQVRQAVVQILLEADRFVEPALSTAINDPSIQVQHAAVEALAHIPLENSLPALEWFVSHPDPVLRAAAARSMGELSSFPDLPVSLVLPLLYGLLKDPDPWTRLAACRALSRYQSPESLGYLRLLTEDPVVPVRMALVEALGNVNSLEALALLAILEADPVPAVQQAARQILFNISTQNRDVDEP